MIAVVLKCYLGPQQQCYFSLTLIVIVKWIRHCILNAPDCYNITFIFSIDICTVIQAQPNVLYIMYIVLIKTPKY